MSKHKILAILMAPFLAIGGYIAAGYFSETTPPVRTLIIEDDCDLANNHCVLKTAGLQLELSADQALHTEHSVTITMKSSEKLNDVLVSLAAKKQQSSPFRLQKQDNNNWTGEVLIDEKTDRNKLMLRLVIDWQGQLYFADEKAKL